MLASWLQKCERLGFSSPVLCSAYFIAVKRQTSRHVRLQHFEFPISTSEPFDRFSRNFVRQLRRCSQSKRFPIYRGEDKSLVRPGRKQATATEDFDVHISYYHNWRNISNIYIKSIQGVPRVEVTSSGECSLC